MKTLLAILALALGLASCGGPRSYQVEAHASGGAIHTVSGQFGSTAAIVGSTGKSVAETEADKAASFFGGGHK